MADSQSNPQHQPRPTQIQEPIQLQPMQGQYATTTPAIMVAAPSPTVPQRASFGPPRQQYSPDNVSSAEQPPNSRVHTRNDSTSAIPLVSSGFNRPSSTSPDHLDYQPNWKPQNPTGLAKPRFGIESRRWRLTLSYAPDWLLTIALTAAFWFIGDLDGYKREFDLTDTSIQHTFAVHERVPNWMLIALCFGAPVVILPLINFLTVRSYWDLHNSYLGLVLSLGITGVITNAVKVTVGRPRPDLIDRCQPIPGSVNAPVYGLVTAAICTQTDHVKLNDGFRSFPSGHSSLSFAGLGFLSFYLAGKLHLWDTRGHTGKAWLSLGPMLGAALIAVSRTMDNRHHYQDVTVGSILGLTVSYFAYRQYYPQLSSPESHRPFSPRIPSDKHRLPPLPQHHSHTVPARPTYPYAQYSDSRSPSPYSFDREARNPGDIRPVPRMQPPRQFSSPVNSQPYRSRSVESGETSPFEDDAAVAPGKSSAPQSATLVAPGGPSSRH